MTYKLNIKDLPIDERPRERLVKEGAYALSNSELLAIILRTGNEKENVLEMSKRLIKEHELRKMSRLGASELKKSFGIGEAKACQMVACFELGRRVNSIKAEKNKTIRSAKDAAKILMPELSYLKKEHLIGLFLDSRMKVIKKETIFTGSLNSSVIHPRDIFKKALDESAAAVIIAHNHPSGDPSPSEEDIQSSIEMKKAGDMLGIQFLDHIIIGDNKYFSLKEKDKI